MPSICLSPSLIWEITKFLVPTIVSCLALLFVLKDRYPGLDLRSKVGDWCKLNMTMEASEVMFRGLIEVYNRSSRANAIRAYRFECKTSDGAWKLMESEQYTNNETNGVGGEQKKEVFNQTALTIPPYSGQEAKVQALVRMARPREGLLVRIEVDDLFGKKYKLDVKATF